MGLIPQTSCLGSFLLDETGYYCRWFISISCSPVAMVVVTVKCKIMEEINKQWSEGFMRVLIDYIICFVFISGQLCTVMITVATLVID